MRPAPEMRQTRHGERGDQRRRVPGVEPVRETAEDRVVGVGEGAAEGGRGADRGEEGDWVEVGEDFDEEFRGEFEEGGFGVVGWFVARVC